MIARLLARWAPKPPAAPLPEILEAAMVGDWRRVRTLGADGGNLDARTPETGSILALAVRRAPESVVLWLLGEGVSPHHRDRKGRTVLGQAVRHRSSEIVAALLAAGANPNAPEPAGVDPPLLASLRLDHHGTPRTLLRAGAVPCAQSQRRMAPRPVEARAGGQAPALNPRVADWYGSSLAAL